MLSFAAFCLFFLSLQVEQACDLDAIISAHDKYLNTILDKALMAEPLPQQRDDTLQPNTKPGYVFLPTQVLSRG